MIEQPTGYAHEQGPHRADKPQIAALEARKQSLTYCGLTFENSYRAATHSRSQAYEPKPVWEPEQVASDIGAAATHSITADVARQQIDEAYGGQAENRDSYDLAA